MLVARLKLINMIPIYAPELGESEQMNLLECVKSGWISSQGKFVERLEVDFANWHSMEFGISTSNCTTALHLVLAALEIGVGDEVLCPDLTFIAPANMIKLTGATPVLVDVEEPSWGINPGLIESKITSRTRAIIVVHAFGHTADLDPIKSIAEKHSLYLIEDVAEAPGALYKGQLAGTFGTASVYSFFANKIMTTGEGGMVLTNDASLAKNLRIIRDHGMSREYRYRHQVLGFNYRMTNMQAAVGVAQLERLDRTLLLRQEQEDRYKKLFGANSRVKFRPHASWCKSVHWMTTITLRRPELRDALIDFMGQNHVDCRQMVFPVHAATHFASQYSSADFPISDSISTRSMHCPSGTGLTIDEQSRIGELVVSWLKSND